MTMSTPTPPVSSLAASLNPSMSTASSAPASRATWHLASVEQTAMVRAPYPLATWMVAVPTPPAAPCTSTVSPFLSPPRSASANWAVR